MIFDAHLHNKNKENGGFLIGTEGTPFFEGTLTNKEVLKFHDPSNFYFAFYYVSNEESTSVIAHDYLKYHPRREKYYSGQIIKSIKLNKPKAVMIDTLNEPFFSAYDYWSIARAFPDIFFIFAHSGGYLINDFIKICHFQTNVWLDFSLTHTTLAKLGDKKGLSYVNDAISYSLNGSFCERILLGSDWPFFDQKAVFNFYQKHIKLLNNNFLKLLEKFNEPRLK